MSTTEQIITSNIAKTGVYQASNLFNKFFVIDKETINSLDIEARKENVILDSLSFLNVPVKYNAPPRSNYKTPDGSIINEYRVKRTVKQTSAVLGPITSATQNTTKETPDTDDVYISTPNRTLRTVPDVFTYEHFMTSTAQGHFVDFDLYDENVVKKIDEHQITQNEFLNYHILHAITKEQYPVKKFINGVASSGNESFSGEFLGITTPLSLIPQEIHSIPQKLFRARKRALNRDYKIVIYCTIDMLNKFLENVAKDGTEATRLMVQSLADAQLRELLNQNKNNNGALDKVMNYLAERSRLQVTTGNVRLVAVQQHQEALLLNSAGNAFELKFLMEGGLDSVNFLTPAPVNSHMAFNSAQSFSNNDRMYAQNLNGVWIGHEIKNGVQNNTFMDNFEAFTLSSRDIIPNDFTKGGSLPLDNNAIFGSTAATNAKVAEAKQNFNDWADKIGGIAPLV